MMALSLVQEDLIGDNLEAYTIYAYPKHFWITSKTDITGICSKIRIERKTHNITQYEV